MGRSLPSVATGVIHLLHANLGTSPAWDTGIALAAAGALELLAQLLLR